MSLSDYSDGPVLYYQPPAAQKPLRLDLDHKTLAYRMSRVAHEPLIKACGLKAHASLQVVDATAGFGQDSVLLAAAGAQVIMLERNPILQQWLKDLLDYLPNAYPKLKGRLDLHCVDALTWLADPTKASIDIIYLDPMFPERKKNAKVQKRMAFLQEILGDETGEEALLDLALSIATRRVVIKRPRLAPSLGAHKPSFSHTYRSCRFDVYLIPKTAVTNQ